MHILIYVYSDKDCGTGHLYRAVSIFNAAQRHNHKVAIVGNIMLPDTTCFQARRYHRHDLEYWIEKIKPDAIIVDLQEGMINYVHEVINKYSLFSCLISGVGRIDNNDADIHVIQGIIENVHIPKGKIVVSGSEWIILRDDITKHSYNPGKSWLVFGGSSDKIEMLWNFSKAMNNTDAMLVASPYGIFIPPETDRHIVYWPQGKAIFRLMSRAKSACVATGMIVWELIAMGVPTYCFSLTEGHLQAAQAMERHSMVRAYPQIGIPDTESFKHFLSLPPIVPQTKPDGRGAERLVELLERSIL